MPTLAFGLFLGSPIALFAAGDLVPDDSGTLAAPNVPAATPNAAAANVSAPIIPDVPAVAATPSATATIPVAAIPVAPAATAPTAAAPVAATAAADSTAATAAAAKLATRTTQAPSPAAGIAPEEMPPDAFTRYRAPASWSGAASESPSADKTGPRYDIAMPWGEQRFESFRSAYLSKDGLRWLAAVSERAAAFMPYIAERIRFYGLPEELAYLPVIESEFSPKAVSKSGASGLWQFMKNSISGYGIGIDDWVDERRDFMKSTDAALRKLADNYAYLGNWELALAAYNAGLGAVSRAVKKGEGADYWELSRLGLLPKETMSYVPKFLAAASVLRYPKAYGLKVEWKAPTAWERVPLDRAVDLSLLAEAAGLPVEELRKANAELRYTVTPPYSGYGLKVPAASAAAVKAVVEDPALKLIRYYMHKVRSGDTLSALSRHYGTPQAMILQANPGLKADLLKLGQVVVIPALKEAGPPPKAEIEGAARELSGSHIVAKGDTLWSLSLKYEIQPELLAEGNGLELGGMIREGMRLRVPILE